MSARIQAVLLAATVAVVGLFGLSACGRGGEQPPAPVAPFGLPSEVPAAGGGAMRALSYSVPCYTAQGGANIVASSGCTITVEEGGTLDLDDGATVTGVVSNSMAGAALKLDPGGTTKIQATANYAPILTVGGTPTAASFRINDSAGTPVAVLRGGGGESHVPGSLLVGGGQSLLGHLTLGTSTPAAVVTGTAVAPGAMLQPLSMATAGTVPITIPSAGRYVCVWNTGSQGITIADSGNQVLAGNITLGQYDVLCGISDGTRFIEIHRSNN